MAFGACDADADRQVHPHLHLNLLLRVSVSPLLRPNEDPLHHLSVNFLYHFDGAVMSHEVTYLGAVLHHYHALYHLRRCQKLHL